MRAARSIADLDALLPPDPHEAPIPSVAVAGPSQAVNPKLLAVLDQIVNDVTEVGRRSHAIYRAMCKCAESGLDDVAMAAMLRRYSTALEKWGKISNATAIREVKKARARHPHPGQLCIDAGCPHVPDWQRKDREDFNRRQEEVKRRREAQARLLDQRDRPPVTRVPAPDDVAGAPKDALDPDDEEVVVADIADRPLFTIRSLAELAADVDGREPVPWLIRRLWPGDGYGVLAAEKKAGKTWLILDLAVNVSAGRSWLGRFPVDTPGPVLVFLGEGGDRKMLRRFRAIGANYGLDVEQLPIHVEMRVPHLTDLEHLAAFADALDRVRPVLVIVDPLYLAARGADTASLVAMGEALENVQLLCQQVGAALVVAHHWNKTGQGNGAHRMSGAGPAEWGRVLVTVNVETKREGELPASTWVLLNVKVEGDEVPDTEFNLVREVWAEDPDDLSSPLNYRVTVNDAPTKKTTDGLSPSQRRVLAALRSTDRFLYVSQIGDIVAGDGDGKPLRARTIQDACKELRAKGMVRPDREWAPGDTDGLRWASTTPADGGDDDDL